MQRPPLGVCCSHPHGLLYFPEARTTNARTQYMRLMYSIRTNRFPHNTAVLTADRVLPELPPPSRLRAPPFSPVVRACCCLFFLFFVSKFCRMLVEHLPQPPLTSEVSEREGHACTLSFATPPLFYAFFWARRASGR